MNSIHPDKVAEAALAYKGMRYRKKGRGDDGAVDCIGLLICVARDLGIDHGFEYLNYTDWPDGKILYRDLKSQCPEDPEPKPETGKIGLFYFYGIRRPMHVAIFGKNGTIIDPSFSKKKVIHVTWRPELLKGGKLIATFDYKEVAQWRLENACLTPH